MKKIIESIGLGDGEGNTSSMRVYIFLVLIAWLISKVVVAIKTSTVIQFNDEDLKLLGVLFGAKVAQNFQEGKPAIDVQTTSVQPVKP